MLKPFRIRDLLIPTDEEELDHPGCPPLDGQDGPKPIPRSHPDGELVMAYKQPNNGDDGKFCPYSTYDLQSIPSTDADGRTAKKGIDILIPGKPPSDRNDMSSNLRRNKWTNATVTPSPATDRHGIVRVSAEEYDETIAAHPQSKLTYMDEDDGDTITVCSAFELTERLNEPATSAFVYQSAVSSYDQGHEGPMHIFDVNRTKSVLDIWRSFEKRTAMENRRLDASVSAHHEATAAKAVDGNSDVRPEPVCKISSSNDPRDHRLQSQNSPPTPQTTWHQNEIASIPPVSSLGGDEPSEPRASTDVKPSQETTFRHRHARGSTSDTQISIPPVSLPAINPWASVGTWPSGFESNGLTQREPESRESPIEDNVPLLASFEAELSKIMKEKPVDSPTIEAREQNTTQTISQCPPASHPVPKPAEVFAQTMQTLLTSVRHLTSELRAKLPEVERRLSNAHQTIPSTVETTLFNTLSAIGSHVQNLANAMQATATSSRAAADMSREADLLATDQIVNGLRTLARDIRQMGRTMFASFDATSGNVGSQDRQSGELPLGNADTLSQSNQLSTSLSNVCLDNSHPSDPLPEVPTSPASTESVRQTAFPQETPLADSNSNTTLFIGNLHDAVTEQDVAAAFADKGFLGKVNLPHDFSTGKHAGFGFVDFPCFFAASGALHALNGGQLHGQVINLEFNHGVGIINDSAIQQPPTRAGRVSETHRHRNISRPLPDIPKSPRLSVYDLTRTSALDDARNSGTASAGIRRAKSLGTLRRPVVHDPPYHRAAAMDYIREQIDQERSNVEVGGSPYHSSTNSEQKTPKTSYSAVAVGNNVLADQLDPEPEFSARYPSLVPETYNHDGNQSHQRPRQSQDVSRSLSLESQMARFPTVSQLESRTSTMQRPQPRDKRSPSRSPIATAGSSLPETLASDDHARNLRDLHPQPPPAEGRGIPGSWPPELYSAQLMRPRASSPTRPSELRRSNTIASNSAVRLSGPFVPFTERHQRNGHSSLRRSATERQNRRPPRVAFSRHRHALEDRAPIPNPHLTPGQSADAISNIPGSFPVETIPPVPPKSIHQSAERQPEMQEQSRPTNDIDRCIAHLGLLGYGYDPSLPSHNLHIYAEASNGNLEDAIEMIEEERKAYEQRTVFR
ncbi:RNA binding domain-containing protein [Histoplasma capsulatum G186AR]|uniref:RNA binding domain-containing protein n=1 Tax=Ajellomyces capsulatus (strain G186AR / H82 / ATCC MYA-2454 / RMSCC 2432) TaxID=447093 RepID=C0NGQ7_AJECG|nr:RNA binding domain-containing protein [Histoplasma capsulatum G186AR]EEH08992.1 RNA binding domain-containing protein [Histoplasma capsulatum G186AR]